MATSPNQPWDLGQAMAEFSNGIFKGVVDFFGLVMRPFENCGLGQESESANNEQTEGDSVAADGRLVVHRGIMKDKHKSRRLTKETLGRLSAVGAPACRGSTSSAGSSNTLGTSTESSLSGSVSGEDGEGVDGVGVKDTEPRVKFDHGVDVRVEWHAYLARTRQEVGTAGRDRAATMVDGDEFSSLVEAAPSSATRTTVVQPQRVLSRAARFALMEDDGDGDGDGKGGRKPVAYGRMKDIVSFSRRGGVNAIGGEDEDDDEEEEEEEGLAGLFESYDGSLASMKRLVFPPTISSGRYINSRPVKKLFDDASALASRSPAQWMTQTELDGILRRTKGWKDGTGGRSRRGRGGARGARREKSYGFDGEPDSRASVRHEMCRVSVDNTVLKDQLFGLAMEEHRASLLFKRAFLNWEGSVSSL